MEGLSRNAEGSGCVVAVTVVGFKRRFDNGSLYTRELMFERLSASVDVAFTNHRMLAKFLAAMLKADELGVPSKRGYPDPENAQANLFDDDWFIAQAVEASAQPLEIRLMADQDVGNENVRVYSIVMYVR